MKLCFKNLENHTVTLQIVLVRFLLNYNAPCRSPRKCIDDGLLRLATFNERENNNSENLELDKLPQILYEEVQSSISVCFIQHWTSEVYLK